MNIFQISDSAQDVVEVAGSTPAMSCFLLIVSQRFSTDEGAWPVLTGQVRAPLVILLSGVGSTCQFLTRFDLRA